MTMEEEDSRSYCKDEPAMTSPNDSSIYSGIRGAVLDQIKRIDLNGYGSSSFGTKIDTLARNILWVRKTDPGAKSIVFSQYKDFLDVLARAFSQFKIGFAGIDQKNGVQKFKSDPSVGVVILSCTLFCWSLLLGGFASQ